jgi:hypothetical protein
VHETETVHRDHLVPLAPLFPRPPRVAAGSVQADPRDSVETKRNDGEHDTHSTSTRIVALIRNKRGGKGRDRIHTRTRCPAAQAQRRSPPIPAAPRPCPVLTPSPRSPEAEIGLPRLSIDPRGVLSHILPHRLDVCSSHNSVSLLRTLHTSRRRLCRLCFRSLTTHIQSPNRPDSPCHCFRVVWRRSPRYPRDPDYPT